MEYLSGQRQRTLLHLLWPGMHHWGPKLRSSDVCALHIGSMLPQQARPHHRILDRSGLPLLSQQHIPIGGCPDQGKHLRQPVKAKEIEEVREFKWGKQQLQGLIINGFIWENWRSWFWKNQWQQWLGWQAMTFATLCFAPRDEFVAPLAV